MYIMTIHSNNTHDLFDVFVAYIKEAVFSSGYIFLFLSYFFEFRHAIGVEKRVELLYDLCLYFH